MARVQLARDRSGRPQHSRIAGRFRRGCGNQGQAHGNRGAHYQRQRCFLHGEQSEIPRCSSDPGRNGKSTGGVSVMEIKTKFELKLGVATREAFGKALVEAGRQNKDVVALDADLSKSTYTHFFAKEFPDRFIECGIAEANMIAIGAGLASAGKIPFAASFSCFAINKGFEQLRVTAAFPNVNLKVVGTHSGISIGEDGPSQMSIEDLGLACSLPGFAVLSPADEVSMRALG